MDLKFDHCRKLNGRTSLAFRMIANTEVKELMEMCLLSKLLIDEVAEEVEDRSLKKQAGLGKVELKRVQHREVQKDRNCFILIRDVS